MSKQKLLSFIIPVYNGEKTIAKCINTIISNFNEYQNEIEIIVINDGSNDNTLKSIEQIKFKNLRIISKNNGGVSSARNIGIENAIGKYIWFIDSDDYLLQFDGNCLIGRLNHNLNIDVFLFGFKKRINPNDVKVVCNKKDEVLNHTAFIKKFNNIFSENEFNVPWNRIIKRSIVKEHKIRFDPQMSVGEDSAFNCELVPYINKINIINQPLYMYNLFLSGGIKGYNPQLRFNLLKLNNVLKSLINNQGIDRAFFENKYERMNFSLLVNLAQNCDNYEECNSRLAYETLPRENIYFFKLSRKAKVFYLLTKFNRVGYKVAKKQ